MGSLPPRQAPPVWHKREHFWHTSHVPFILILFKFLAILITNECHHHLLFLLPSVGIVTGNAELSSLGVTQKIGAGFLGDSDQW